MAIKKSSGKKTKSTTRREPQQHRSQSLQSDVIEAGFKALELYGLNRLSTNKIAEVAGVSIGSIYQYFTNKEEIIQKMVHYVAGELMNKAVAEMRSIDEPDQVAFVEKFIRTMFSVFLKRRSISALLFFSLSDESGLKVISQNRKIFCERLKEYVDERYPLTDLSRKALRKDLLEVLVHSFMGVVQAVLLEELSAKENARICDAFVSMAKASVIQNIEKSKG